MMAWIVEFHPEFNTEINQLSSNVRVELLAHARLLAEFGPTLKRPHADTLNGSGFANMKELRFKAGGGVWRVAFAFDPRRHGIMLVAGNKTTSSSRRFYKDLIAKADARYREHLTTIGRKL
jgi:hypothetical protein